MIRFNKLEDGCCGKHGEWLSVYNRCPDCVYELQRIVEEYITLKKSREAFIAPCPFHKEKTPSFSINFDKDLYKCFGCGESGNIETLIHKLEEKYP